MFKHCCNKKKSPWPVPPTSRAAQALNSRFHLPALLGRTVGPALPPRAARDGPRGLHETAYALTAIK